MQRSKTIAEDVEQDKLSAEFSAQLIKAKAEESKIRADNNRKMQEHKQRVDAMKKVEYLEQDYKRAQAADEMQWISFETRMQALVKRMIDPVFALSVEQREANIDLETCYDNLKRRCNILEQAIFRKNESQCPTIFDDYEKKLSEINIQVRQDAESLKYNQDKFAQEIKLKLFHQDQNVQTVLNVGEAVKELNLEKENLRIHMNKLSEQQIEALNNLRDISNERDDYLQQQIQDLKKITYEHGTQLVKLEEDRQILTTKVEKSINFIEKVNFDVGELSRIKVNVSSVETSFGNFADKLRKLREAHVTLGNQQISLENWVEKYLPLKLQHQIVETVGEVITKDKRQQLYDISKAMSRVLRKEIMMDVGDSKLRAATLDLITNLRLEDQLLNQKKTQRFGIRTQVPTPSLKESHAKDLNDTTRLQKIIINQLDKAEEEQEVIKITATPNSEQDTVANVIMAMPNQIIAFSNISDDVPSGVAFDPISKRESGIVIKYIDPDFNPEADIETHVSTLINKTIEGPEHLQKILNLRDEKLIDFMTKKLSEAVFRIDEDIGVNGAQILEVKSSVNQNLEKVNRQLIENITTITNVSNKIIKLSLDQQMVERDVGKTRLALKLFLEQAQINELLLQSLSQQNETFIKMNPLMVTPARANTIDKSIQGWDGDIGIGITTLFKSLNDVLHKCKRVIVGGGSNQVGFPEVQTSIDRMYVHQTNGKTCLVEPSYSQDLCDQVSIESAVGIETNRQIVEAFRCQSIESNLTQNISQNSQQMHHRSRLQDNVDATDQKAAMFTRFNVKRGQTVKFESRRNRLNQTVQTEAKQVFDFRNEEFRQSVAQRKPIIKSSLEQQKIQSVRTSRIDTLNLPNLKIALDQKK